MDKVVDPSAGSYYVEVLTNSLADVAWKLFLEVEDKGGFGAGYTFGEVVRSLISLVERTNRDRIDTGKSSRHGFRL